MPAEEEEKSVQTNGAGSEGAAEKRFKMIFFGVIIIAIAASVIILGGFRPA